MLIEEFYRLGRALLMCEPEPARLLELVTDVGEDTVKNFYRNVFVVELPRDGQGDPSVCYQVFGSVQDTDDFVTDVDRAVGIPFSLPTGGNPLQPQGRYGLPVYPCYDPHLRGFQQSVEEVSSFLAGRLVRTPGLAIGPDLLQAVARRIHECVRGRSFGKKKVLGVVALADCREGECYSLASGAAPDRIGVTADGQSIVPNYPRILDAVLAARVEEGRGAGEKSGRCTFSGEEGALVSAYCKAWPWALPTWTCPLPRGGDAESLIESVALAPASYRALTIGACVFDKLTRPLARVVVHELFSPADTRGGKDQAQRRKPSDLPSVRGSVLLAPVHDRIPSAEDERDFAEGVWAMLRPRDSRRTQACRYLETVTGFDSVIPEGLPDDDFRLTLVYFSGEVSRGDVHLRATIDDVVPNTLGRLCDLSRELAVSGLGLAARILPRMSEKQRAYLGACYASVPYLLARAYGGGHLWRQLERVLHRQPLGARAIIANAARRMESLLSRWPDGHFPMLDEVAFLLHVRTFTERVNRDLAEQPDEDPFMPTRDWRELIEAYLRRPVQEMHFLTPAELGFACGLLVRRFGGWYRFVLGADKDYLRDRVLTFGASLSPHQVWTRAINGICDTAPKYDRLRDMVERSPLGHWNKDERHGRFGDFRQRLSAVQSELERRQDDLVRHRDDFMTGFWSGYGLLDHDRNREPKQTAEPTP